MTIYENKINADYANVSNFLKEEGISENVYNHIKRKKTSSFRKGSEALKACEKLRKMGYMPKVEER